MVFLAGKSTLAMTAGPDKQITRKGPDVKPRTRGCCAGYVCPLRLGDNSISEETIDLKVDALPACTKGSKTRDPQKSMGIAGHKTK